jgi:hypothetical protein
MKKLSLTQFSSLAAVFCLLTAPLHAETITITQAKSGKSLEVIVKGVEAGVVSFETPAGKAFSIPGNQLTPESIEAVKKQLAAASKPASSNLTEVKSINEVIGHNLFGEVPSLWKEDAAAIAERLDWRLESRKANTSSYRLYTKLDYLFLGAHPYCVTLYGGEGNLAKRISLVYANKGDFGSRLGMGEDHFKITFPDKKPPGDLNEAIEFDAEMISEKLVAGLGEPVEQYYGEKEDKRKVKRWDFNDHAFLLSTTEDEYTTLLIVSTENADLEGKVDFIVDSDFRKIQIKNVVTEENGDVWVDNIPMVDQGPKGYCAPATFERAMRYMNVPADMYLLATAATSAEGGTNTSKLSEDCKRIVRSKARRIKELELQEDFEIKELKKFIDKGVPVLWQMCSLKQYNDIANERSAAREEVTDFAKWSTEISAEATQYAPIMATNRDNYHICMVIGYNEATNEVAVSDSWGPRYEIRWVHVDIAKAVTSRGGFAIDF